MLQRVPLLTPEGKLLNLDPELIFLCTNKKICPKKPKLFSILMTALCALFKSLCAFALMSSERGSFAKEKKCKVMQKPSQSQEFFSSSRSVNLAKNISLADWDLKIS